MRRSNLRRLRLHTHTGLRFTRYVAFTTVLRFVGVVITTIGAHYCYVYPHTHSHCQVWSHVARIPVLFILHHTHHTHCHLLAATAPITTYYSLFFHLPSFAIPVPGILCIPLNPLDPLFVTPSLLPHYTPHPAHTFPGWVSMNPGWFM